MRIRSIRPEFWSSEDIAALSWERRLIYIGLWSYVDDNGVGRDNPKLIAADLFPLEDSPPVMQIAGALSEYSKRQMITRYTVNGKPFLHVTAWKQHQKINRPSDGRYPLPTREDAEIHTPLAEPSLSPHAELPLGEGEKGRRGTATRTKVAAPEPESETAQTLTADWINGLKARPPGQVVGQVAKLIGAMLGEGIPADDIKAGIEAWQLKGLHPSTLPSVVHEIRNQPRAATSYKHTADKACTVPGHENYPAHACAGCRTDRLTAKESA